MGLLTALITGGPIVAGTPGPTSDFWYGNPGTMSSAGVRVSADTSLKLSAFYRGVDLIARALAAVPWVINRNLPDDEGQVRAKEHPWYPRLHRRPNLWQTSAEFRYFGQWRVLLRGNFYCRRDLIRGDEVLTPLDPDRMTVRLLETGRRGYLFQPARGNAEPYVQDEIFHVMGATRTDGAAGLGVVERARESLGRWIAQQEFGARFFAQNATPATVLTHPGRLSGPAQTNLEKKVEERVGGLQGAHKMLVLEEGMKVEKIGLTLRDSQFVEIDTFGVIDVCRWLGVQPHKVYELSRATFSNIEHQAIEFLTDTMDPWFVFWEQAAERDLIEDPETFSVKFIREGLLRGDLLSRAQGYAQFIQNGVMAENEVREREGLRKFPGLDEPRRSANQDRGGDPNAPRPSGPPERRGRAVENDDEDDEESARARAIASASASRVVRKEVSALRTQSLRRQGEDWRRWCAEFYGRHVDVIAEALCLTETEARRYGVEHCAAACASASLETLLDEWERDAPAALAALALGR